MATKKVMSRAQVASLGGLAVAEKTDMKRLGSHGGAATVERYGKSHMKKLALRKHGYNVELKTEQPEPETSAAYVARVTAAIKQRRRGAPVDQPQPHIPDRDFLAERFA